MIITFIISLMLGVECNFLGRTSNLSRILKTVYLLPHSHDDVGWLDTVDGIYERGPGVKNIITSYINALTNDSKRKFVQVEIVYFKRWWNDQGTSMRSKVKQLIQNKQLDFAQGGWVMNDEATAYYEDIIDQLSDGHKFLFQELNVIVKVGWQIDPFGHSATQSKLNYLLGMDAQFYTRIDYQDRENRKKNKKMELVIQDQETNIFTHINYDHYSSPSGFDFDPNHYAHSQAIQDTQIPQKANALATYFQNVMKFYNGKVICHTLGDDNEWSQAEDYFKNVEKVVNYINSKPDDFGIEVKFGTPNDYIEEVYDQQLKYEPKNDDFFPYADKEHSYWTGYFTSRVAFKGLIRQSGRYYQQIRNYFASQLSRNHFISQASAISYAMQNTSEVLGILQHHDAVTGTAKQSVTNDYIKILSRSLKSLNDLVHQTVKQLIKEQIEESIDNLYQYNWNASSSENNETYQAIIDGKAILITLLDTKYQQSEFTIIRIKVPQLPLIIQNQQNQQIEGDIICSNQTDSTDCDLFFIHNQAQQINSLSFYKIKTSTPDKATAQIISPQPQDNYTEQSKITLNNGKSFVLQYHYYNSSNDLNQPSGAYIFRPEQQQSQPFGQLITTILYQGRIVTELYQNRTYCQAHIRSYSKEQNQYQIETFIDSIPNLNQKGREIIMLIDTDINNEQTFYTDSNGLHLQKRVINHRDTWVFRSNEKVAENYYPITALFSINDTTSRASLITDRAQGATSQQKGQIEIMLHRRMYRDDRRGVGESLNEQEDNPKCIINKIPPTTNTRTTNPPAAPPCERTVGLRQKVQHTLVFSSNSDLDLPRKVQLQQDLQPILMYGVSDTIDFKQVVMAGDKSLLDGINIITNAGEKAQQVKLYLIPWDYNSTYLVRIQNFYENQKLSIEWPEQFKKREMTLNGIQELSEWKKNKKKWLTSSDGQFGEDYQFSDEIQPLQIRTFMINL